MRRILIITDSLGFPRKEPEFVSYCDTYVALLKERFPHFDFIHHGRGGSTIDELFEMAWYYQNTLSPDIVFIQSGIVDCAPRAMTLNESRLISLLPLIRRPVSYVVRKMSRVLRSVRKITYTSPESFYQYTMRFNDIFNNVYWIGILPASKEYEAKLNGVKANIWKFNQILNQSKFISTEHFGVSDVMSDFHHLSVAGHKKLFNLITELIIRELGQEVSLDSLKRLSSST